MAWPAEQGSLGLITVPRRLRRARRPRFHVRPSIAVVEAPQPGIIALPRSRRIRSVSRPVSIVRGAAWRGEHRFTFSGSYRVENATEFRIYWGLTPPQLGDPIKATTGSLPYSPADTFGDGHWYFSMTVFDGFSESGFLPLGPKGQTYREMVIASGAQSINPPQIPAYWHLETKEGGVVRIIGVYDERGETRAEEWAITFTSNGSVPAVDTPTIDPGPSMDITGKEDLSYDLNTGGLPHGTTINARRQVRRDDDGTWSYSPSEDLTLGQAGYLTIDTDKIGPSVPVGAESWPGRTPEDL